MKKIMIIGSSSGIGKATAEYFLTKGYEVTTVSRKEGSTYVGEITKEEFRNFLVENSSPDIVINCAGTVMGSTTEVLTLNTVATADLILKFYEKLEPGSDIITVSSIGATASLFGDVPNHSLIYYNTKDAISTLSVALSKGKKKDIRVSVLEPDKVMPTNLAKILREPVPPERYTDYNFEQFTPIAPGYIPEVIEWMINQPRWINISRMTINNNCKPNYANPYVR